MSKSVYKLIPPETLALLSKETKDGYKASFDRLDSNGDGCLEFEEIGKLLSLYKVNSHLGVVALFICDLDHSGSITFDEFINFISILSDLEKDSTILYRNTFNIFDADSNGYLEGDEIRKFIGFFTTSSLPEEKYQKLFKAIDANGDGKLSFEEVCRFLDIITED